MAAQRTDPFAPQNVPDLKPWLAFDTSANVEEWQSITHLAFEVVVTSK